MNEPIPKDRLLTQNILLPHELTEAEKWCAGTIVLEVATRYSATLLLSGSLRLRFSFDPYSELGVTGVPSTMHNDEPILLKYAWHRACEAMLAVRRGHHVHAMKKKAGKTSI